MPCCGLRVAVPCLLKRRRGRETCGSRAWLGVCASVPCLSSVE